MKLDETLNILRRISSLKEDDLCRFNQSGKVQTFVYPPSFGGALELFISNYLLKDRKIRYLTQFINVWKVYLDIIERRDILKGILSLEQEESSKALISVLREAITVEDVYNEIASKIIYKPTNLIIYGLGGLFPFVDIDKLLYEFGYNSTYRSPYTYIMFAGRYDGHEHFFLNSQKGYKPFNITPCTLMGYKPNLNTK